MVEEIVDLWPKCAYNIFTGGRTFAELVGFKIEMSILPGLKRFFNGVSKRQEIVECSASFIVRSAERCLGKITMAVTAWVTAFAIEFRVLGLGETSRMQTMCGMDRHLHSKKNAFVIPDLGEEIVPFVQR